MSINQFNKPTPGPWIYWNPDEWTHCILTAHGELPSGEPNTWAVMSMNSGRDEADANARFITGAHKVFEETGLTPRQLLEQRDALEEALILMVRTHDEPAESLCDEVREMKWLSQARAALALVKGEAQ